MSDEDDRALRGIERRHADPGAPLTERDMFAMIGRVVTQGDAARLIRDLSRARADLAAETATRTALRTQASQVSGLLADAGVPVGDLVAGVAALVAERDGLRGHAVAVDDEQGDDGAALDEMRSARDVLLAEVDRLRALVGEACDGWEDQAAMPTDGPGRIRKAMGGAAK